MISIDFEKGKIKKIIIDGKNKKKYKGKELLFFFNDLLGSDFMEEVFRRI